MKSSVDDFGPNLKAGSSRPAPRYNLISIALPFLGGLTSAAFLQIVGIEGNYGSKDWNTKVSVVVVLMGVSCVLGLITGGIAWARAERFWGLTALGLLLNTPLPFLLLRAGLFTLESWRRYG